MSWEYWLTQLLLIWTIRPSLSQDPQVKCQVFASCLLPCAFKPGQDEVIHWYHERNNDNPVHSYYQGQDRFTHQDKQYKGRTSLSPKEDIMGGEASLTLKDVKTSDEGRYRCYTSTSNGRQDKYVVVQVYSPIKQVNVSTNTDTLTCKSEEIFPVPNLIWSFQPPGVTVDHDKPETQLKAHGLFSITSKLSITPNVTYNCTVAAGQHKKWASFRRQSINTDPDKDVQLPCSVPEVGLEDFTLVWLFNNFTILNVSSWSVQAEIQESWKNHLGYTTGQTAIKLRRPGKKHMGMYTCEVTSTEFKYTEETELGGLQGNRILLGPVFIVLFLVFTVVLVAVCKRHLERQNIQTQPETTEMDDCMPPPSEHHSLTNG